MLLITRCAFEAENDSEDVPCLLALLLLSPRPHLVQTILDLYRLS